MRASYFVGQEQFELREKPMPSAGPGQVVIQNAFCGVCGTDVHIFHGEPGSADVTPPVVLGHEYSGVVVDCGEGVASLKKGDHVTVDPNIYCGKCEYCRNGKKQLCEHMEAIGVTMDGGFEEFSVVPEGQAFLLSPELPLEFGAMAEPVACCLHGIDLAGIKPGNTVCVVGGGAIGLIMVQLAVLSGAAKVILSEPDAARRAVARKLGAQLAINPLNGEEAAQAENAADVVIECVGNLPAVESAFRFAKKGATIVLFSVPKPDAKFQLPLFDVYKKELTIKGSFVNPDTHQRAVALLNSGKLDFTEIITHRFGLGQLADAIAMQMSSASIKVIVDTTK